MQLGYSDRCLDHDPGARHPERPDRVRAIRKRLTREHGVSYVDADPAPLETITAVHDAAYVEDLRAFCAAGGGDWDPDTTATEATWEAARTSAGLACWAAQTALDGATGRETPFSIGRPPGHHAVADDAMGFCFLNNVAIAAQHAIDASGATRVAVVDWDVHHGNGTQAIFADRDDVLVVSIHENGLYPGTGALRECGTGPGSGSTLNLPMPSASGDADYVAAFDRVVRPALSDFGPNLVLVSAGFDAHRHDPISRIRLSTEAYACLTDRLRDAAAAVDAGLAFVLEGGYGLDLLAESVARVHQTFDGREPMEPDEEIRDDVEALLAEAETLHDLA